MAEIVYAVHGLRGSLYASLALARRLAACGHRITVIGFRDVSGDVAGAGFGWVRLDDGPRLAAEFDEVRALRGTLRSIPAAWRLRRQMVESQQVVDTLTALEPDLLIADAEMHAVIIPSRRLGIPTLLTVPWFDPFRAPGHPPLHTTHRPPNTWVDRVAIEVAWERLLARRAFDHSLGRIGPRAWRQRVVPFQLNSPSITNVRAVARFHGVGLRELATSRQWVEPLMYPSIPHLGLTASEMDFAHRARPGFHAVGPMIDDDRSEPLVTTDARTMWRRFREEMRRADRRIVYASMGSLQPGNAAFYRRIVDGVRGRDDLALVIGLGGRSDPDALGPPAPNLLTLDYAPQLDVLASAVVAIHHGGIGTLNECVHHGVPSIASSSGFVDEAGTVARLAAHRLGVDVSITEIMGPALLDIVDRVIADAEIGRSLDAMRHVFDRYRTERLAERLVDDALRAAPDVSG